jgi:hypothetical protein
MAVTTETLAEALAAKHITGWYIWKPNQFYARDPSHENQYISVDVVGGDSIDDIVASAETEANTQIDRVDQAGTDAVNNINNYEELYKQTKTIALSAFDSMSEYFNTHGMSALKLIVDNAIRQINEIDDPATQTGGESGNE